MSEQYSFGHWGQTSEEILSKQFPLHRACRDGDLEALSLLLVEAQHGIYEEDNFYGWTPAHWAAYFGKLACLRKLMTTTRVGVNCNIRTSRFRQTPVHLAAFGGHPQCLLWLVSANADLDAQDYLGETAVHKAARTGSMECISLLVSHGARLYIRNNNNQTASNLSTSCGHLECTRYLDQAKQSSHAEMSGVYEHNPSPHAIKTPSPHDVTAQQVHPCVISQGLNGGRLPPIGPHGDGPPGDCPMEESEPDPPARQACGMGGPAAVDVTLHHGVSTNTVPIGGRKRCREDDDQIDHKRRRSDFSLGCNGVVTINGVQPMNGCPSEPVVASGSWNGVSCQVPTVAPIPWPTLSRFPNTTSPSTLHTQQHCFPPIVSPATFPAKGFASLHPPSPPTRTLANGHSGFSTPAAKTTQMFCENNSQGVLPNGHYNGNVLLGGSNGCSSSMGNLLTSSITEHQACVLSEQGYDSMMHETMLS